MKHYKISLLLVTALTWSGLAFPQSALDNLSLSDEQLRDRVAIEALCIEYFYLLDHGQAEKVADLFTDEGVLDLGERVFNGKQAIRDYYAARSKTRITRHVSTNLRLVFQGQDRVQGLRTFTYYGAEGPGTPPAVPSVADYEEVFVRGADGRWRFASRKVTPVFSRND